MDDYTIVIPARYGSSRFPGKMLQPLNDRAMILHTVDRARESRASHIVVATDDARIAEVCDRDGVAVEMTDAAHPSGTDRIGEVARVAAWPERTVIVGLQGDEPATDPRHLDLLASNLVAYDDADMATLCTPILSETDYRDPNRVKVVRDHRGMALYFSRAPIPWRRDPLDDSHASAASFPDAFLHIGLYAWRCGALLNFSTLAPCELESEEKLEQLRLLFNGGRIHVDSVDAGGARGVDHPDDVLPVEQLLTDYRRP